MDEVQLDRNHLDALLSREDLAVGEGLVTVLVAPPGCGCDEFATLLSQASPGRPVRLVTVDGQGAGTVDADGPRLDHDDAWSGFAGAAAESGVAVLVTGPLAEAASAAIWFSPALSLTDGGSVEEARMRLSASAMKSRLVAGMKGGDFEALFGARDVPDHAALSGLVGRIVGYAWTTEGGVQPGRVVLFPDGIDNLSTTVELREEDADDADGA